MKVTRYFLDQVLPRRPELIPLLDRFEDAMRNPIHTQLQPDGRIRRWVYIDRQRVRELRRGS